MVELIISILALLLSLVALYFSISKKNNNDLLDGKSECEHDFQSIGHNNWFMIQQCTKCGKIRRIKLL